MAPGGWRGTQSERRALEGGSVLQGTVGGPSFSQQFLGLHDHSGNRRASSLVALFLVVQEIRHQNTSVGPDHPVWNLALVKQPNEIRARDIQKIRGLSGRKLRFVRQHREGLALHDCSQQLDDDLDGPSGQWNDDVRLFREAELDIRLGFRKRLRGVRDRKDLPTSRFPRSSRMSFSMVRSRVRGQARMSPWSMPSSSQSSSSTRTRDTPARCVPCSPPEGRQSVPTMS